MLQQEEMRWKAMDKVFAIPGNWFGAPFGDGRAEMGTRSALGVPMGVLMTIIRSHLEKKMLGAMICFKTIFRDIGRPFPGQVLFYNEDTDVWSERLKALGNVEGTTSRKLSVIEVFEHYQCPFLGRVKHGIRRSFLSFLHDTISEFGKEQIQSAALVRDCLDELQKELLELEQVEKSQRTLVG